MSNPTVAEEQPIFVLRMSRGMSLLFILTLLSFPILITIFVIPDWIAIVVIWAVYMVLYGGLRFLMLKIASKERIEFYETKFKMIGTDIAVEGFGSLSEREAIQELNYSEITRFKEIKDMAVKKTLFYGIGTKPILTILKTPKRKELGDLRLADWIKMKANLSNQSPN